MGGGFEGLVAINHGIGEWISAGRVGVWGLAINQVFFGSKPPRSTAGWSAAAGLCSWSYFRIDSERMSEESSTSDDYTYVTMVSGDDEYGSGIGSTMGDVSLSFRNVKAWVSNLKVTDHDGSTKTIKRRDILRGVSGAVHSGQMTMLMGASGAGKTTLFDILAARAHSIESSGRILLNGEAFGLEEFHEHAAYVTQDAVFINSLTPNDILWFRANMLLPASLSETEKGRKIDDVIRLLSLDDVRYTRLGTPGVSSRGLNFVQRKRLNIAASLLVDPKVLFLDEPTTGLDASAALALTRSIRKIAHERGIIVFATIHQPSVYVFNLFDQALIMALGQIAYEGPVGEILPFLERNEYPCPKFKNPADHIIEVLDSRDGDFARVQAIIDGSDAVTRGGDDDDDDESAAYSDGYVPLLSSRRALRAGTLRQLFLLTARNVKVTIRSFMGFAASLVQASLFGLLIGAMFDLGKDQPGALDRAGLLLLTVTEACFMALQGSVFVFITERAVFLREVADGTYSSWLYVFSKFLADAPFQILYQVLFVSGFYFLSGLQATFERYAIALAVHCFVSLIGSNLGLCLSAFTGDAATSTVLTPALLVPQMVLASVLISTKDIPAWLAWLKHTSVLRYAFSALLVNEADDGLVFECQSFERLPNGQCLINSGDELIAQRDADDDPEGIGFRVGMLAGLYVLTMFVAFLGLKWSNRNQRKTKST